MSTAIDATNKGITNQNITAAQRLRWLCGELMGGNEFSRDQLERWFLDADAEVRRENRLADAAKAHDYQVAACWGATPVK